MNANSTLPADRISVFSPGTGRHPRVLCFPHAGAHAGFYYRWPPAGVQIQVLDYHGLGKAATATSIADLSERLAASLQSPEDSPATVLFGHSMGAAVAFEVARWLTAAGNPPRAFVASSLCSPHHLPERAALPETLEEAWRLMRNSL